MITARCLGLLLALATPGALANPPLLHGPAQVVDGDTLDVAGARIRLHGIDAPERSQLCENAAGEWYCGQAATAALALLLDGREVACEARDRDRHGRIVAICRVGGTDLSRWLAEQGWALAYRRYAPDYVAAEEAARAAGRGIWSGGFEEPEAYRHRRRPQPAP